MKKKEYNPIKETKNPINIVKTAIYRHKNKKSIFPYYGIRAYLGKYGSGKTLSAVKETIEILTKYPKAVFITNTSIASISNKTYEFTSAEELVNTLVKVVDINNQNGYIVFIDEIHVVFKDLFAKYMDNDFITFLSQLRKLGVYIIGTAQIYSKCPKVVREYLLLNGNIVLCMKIFPGVTLLKHVDMTTAEETNKNQLNAKIQRTEILYHTTYLYESYDTFAVVSQIKAMIKKEEKT